MNILITEGNEYSIDAIREYEKVGSVTVLKSDDLDEILTHLPDTDVLVVKLKYTWTKEILEKAERLKYIVTSTTGLNHIFLPETSKIKIISLKGEVEFLKTITPTAELTWGLILTLYRDIFNAISSVSQGRWERNEHLGVELKGKVIGIIGYGRIGKMVAKYASAFDMQVLAHDLEKVAFDHDNLINNVEQVDLEYLLKRSDIITLHLPLDLSTRNFLSKDKLSHMKHDAIFINTSRGEIVDELHLLYMLENDLLRGAALDVLSEEVSGNEHWMKKNKLINSELVGSRLIITPHIGGACIDSMRNTENFVANKFTSRIWKKS